MLAKLGITSPFNKRKIKEINTPKQLLQQQQQQQQLQQHHVSNIPTPKKFTIVQPTAIEKNVDMSENFSSKANKSIAIASNEIISGIHNRHQQKLASKTSSRSQSPSNRSEASLVNGGGSTPTNSSSNIDNSTCHGTMVKTTMTKLPQLQPMISSSSFAATSKINLDKPQPLVRSKIAGIGVKNSNVVKVAPKSNNVTPVNNVSALNSSSSSKLIPPAVSSKIQPPGSICSQKTNPIDVSTKTVKKVNSSSISNNQSTTIFQSQQNSTTQLTPIAVSTNSTATTTTIEDTANIKPQALNTNMNSSSPIQSSNKSKPSNLAFGLSRLTKVNQPQTNEPHQVNNGDTVNPNTNINTSFMAAKSQPSQINTISASNNNSNSSKIPSLGGLFASTSKIQLKSQSIQLSKPTCSSQTVKSSLPINTSIATKSAVINSTSSSPKVKRAILATTTTTTTTNLSTFQQNSRIASYDLIKSTIVDSNECEVDKDVTKHEKKQNGEKDVEKSQVGNKEFEFEMDGLTDMQDLDKLDDNDEDFQKFLNSTDLTDEDSENKVDIKPNKPENEVVGDSLLSPQYQPLQASSSATVTIEFSKASSGTSSSPSSTSSSNSCSLNNLPRPASMTKQMVESPAAARGVASNKEKEQSPSSSHVSTSSLSCNSTSFLLLPTTTVHSKQLDCQILASSLQPSFGRSNTLDRKLKPINNIVEKISTNSPNRIGSLLTNPQSQFSTIPSLFTQRNSLNIQLKSAAYHQQIPNSGNGKRPLSQDPIMEMNGESSVSPTLGLMNSKPTYLESNSQAINSTLEQMAAELENARNRISSLNNQLNSNSQIIYTLEQTISSLTFKIQSLALNAKKKEGTIVELRNFIDYMQQKYSKIFEGEKQQTPLCLLVRQNSTDSLNSLQSVFSQRSFHSNSVGGTGSSRVPIQADSKGPNGGFKKRSWLRSSFSRAFSRKQQTQQHSDSPLTNDPLIMSPKSKSSERQQLQSKLQCLSDLGENDLLDSTEMNNSSCVGQRYLEFEECSGHFRNLNGFGGDFSLPTSPLHQQQQQQQTVAAFATPQYTHKRNSGSNPVMLSPNAANITEDLVEYQRLLREKEIKLTEIRLENLATAHLLDQSREDNLKLQIEFEQLKSDNLRMQQMLSSLHQHQQQQISNQSTNTNSNNNALTLTVSSPSPSSSVVSSSSSSSSSAATNSKHLNLSLSLHNVETANNASAANEQTTSQQQPISSSASSSSSSMSILKSPSHLMTNPTSCIAHEYSTAANLNEAKRVVVTIYMGDLKDPIKDIMYEKEPFYNQILIGSIYMTTKTNWEQMDIMVKSLFKDYLNKLESKTMESGGLGLNLDSIHYYYVGDMLRSVDSSPSSEKLPDLLPYGYLVSNHTNIVVKLKDAWAPNYPIDSLCFQTLVPKSVMQRYVSLILEHKALLFCGPSGTCKTHMSRKIASYVATRLGCGEVDDDDASVAYFNVETKSVKELKHYLSNYVEQASLCHDKVPCVLVLDNLHCVANISDAFLDFFAAKSINKTKCSYVIGTVNQPNVTSLNLHQNFKWVLCVNHTEPVKNYLKRYAARRLIDLSTRSNTTHAVLEALSNWLPLFWCHVNKYIETYNSVDLTIGPRLFTTYPNESERALEWLSVLWNERLVPMLVDVVREGVELYGSSREKGESGEWQDPRVWIEATWPWTNKSHTDMLFSINAVDVGLDEQEEETSTSNKAVIRQRSTVNNRSVNSRNSNENDKLINMLMRLQEVTGIQSLDNDLLIQKTNVLSLAQCQKSVESSL